MTSSQADGAFERFARTGEPAALADAFDAAAPELARVARHLPGGADGAEDLVQETFLVAIQRREHWDSSRPLVPWLLGILLNLARRRSGARQLGPLEDEPRDARPASDPAESVAALELGAVLRGAVRRLPPRYRDVLIEHVERGEPAAEIARRRRCSASTVRNQVLRGLEQLRRLLPATALGGAASLQPIVSLDAARAAVLAQATTVSPATASATALDSHSAAGEHALAAGSNGAGPVTLGLLTMNKIMLTAAAAVALATLGWMVLPSGDEAVTAGAAKPADDRALSAVDRPEASLPQAPDAAVAKRTAPLTESVGGGDASASGALIVRARFADGGGPAADLGLYVRDRERRELGVERRTDADGTARFARSELSGVGSAGAAMLTTDRGQTVAVVVPAAGETEFELTVPRGTTVSGTVVDWLDRPVAGADVHATRPGHHDGLQRVARTDAAGRFEIRDVGPSINLMARADGHQPSAVEHATGDPDEAVPLDAFVKLELGAPGHRVAGRVVDERGRPVPHALLAVAVDEDARDLEPGREVDHFAELRRRATEGEYAGDLELDLEAALVRADGDGRFETTEVPLGQAVLLARGPRRDGGSIGSVRVFVEPGMDADVEVVVTAGAIVRGAVVDRDGAGQPGLSILTEWGGHPSIGELEHHLGQRVASREATTDADGRFELRGLLPGEHDVWVEAELDPDLGVGDDFALHRERVRVTSGEVVDVRIELDRHLRARFRLVDGDDRPLEGWGVLVGNQGFDLLGRQAADGDGRIVTHPTRVGATTVLVHPPVDAVRFDPLPALVRSVDLGAEELTLVVDPLPSAELAGRLLSSTGEPVSRAILDLRRLDFSGDTIGDRRFAITDDAGRFALPRLAVASYRLQARVADGPETEFGPFDVPSVGLDVGDLFATPQAHLTIEFGAGDALDAVRVAIAPLPRRDGDAGRGSVYARPIAPKDGEYVRGPLAGGRYLVLVDHPERAPTARVVAVDPIADPAPRVVVELGDGVGVPFELDGADAWGGAQATLSIDLVVEGHRLALSRRVVTPTDATSGSRSGFELRLEPGEYLATLRSADRPRRSASASFTVAAGGSPGVVRLIGE